MENQTTSVLILVMVTVTNRNNQDLDDGMVAKMSVGFAHCNSLSTHTQDSRRLFANLCVGC